MSHTDPAPGPVSPAYRLPSQARGEAVRALLQALLDQVVSDLSADRTVAARAHDARKRLKRARGLLRAVRLADPAFYKTENARFRDIARLLAPVRETGADQETMEAVEADYGEVLAPRAFESVRDGLVENTPSAATPEHIQATLDSATANAHLGSAGLYNLSWPVTPDHEADALSRSLARLANRARKSDAALDKKSGPESLHDLRKALKDLWLAEKLYRDLVPDDVLPARKAMRTAIDTLGDIHDIDDLLARLQAGTPGTPPARDALVALLGARRTRLVAILADQREALDLPNAKAKVKAARKRIRQSLLSGADARLGPDAPKNEQAG